MKKRFILAVNVTLYFLLKLERNFFAIKAPSFK